MKTRHIWKRFLIGCILLAILTGCAAATPETNNVPGEISYLALGDSIPAGSGVGAENYVEFFAEYLRDDLGVDVEVQNLGIVGCQTGKLLDILQNDEEIRQAVTDANVITVWIAGNDLATPQNQYLNEMCGGEDNLDCVRENVSEINENIDGILDEILALNASDDTRIMIADINIPLAVFAAWQEKSVFDVLQKELFEAVQGHIIEAANKRGVTVVHTYKAINGASGDQVSADLYVEDGLHLNVQGHRLVADLHREVWE